MGTGGFFTPSPSDFDEWEALIHPENLDERMSPGDAARYLGFAGSATFKRADKVRHAEAMDHWRELNADHADRKGEEWALADDAHPSLRLAWLRRHSPDWNPQHRVETAVSGSVKVEIDYDYAAIAERLEGLGILPRGAAEVLEAEAVEVLPAQADPVAGRGSRRASLPPARETD